MLGREWFGIQRFDECVQLLWKRFHCNFLFVKTAILFTIRSESPWVARTGWILAVITARLLYRTKILTFHNCWTRNKKAFNRHGCVCVHVVLRDFMMSQTRKGRNTLLIFLVFPLVNVRESLCSLRCRCLLKNIIFEKILYKGFFFIFDSII